jgi:hypothetical protein
MPDRVRLLLRGSSGPRRICSELADPPHGTNTRRAFGRVGADLRSARKDASPCQTRRGCFRPEGGVSRRRANADALPGIASTRLDTHLAAGSDESGKSARPRSPSRRSVLLLVRTSSEVGVDGGGCSVTRAAAPRCLQVAADHARSKHTGRFPQPRLSRAAVQPLTTPRWPAMRSVAQVATSRAPTNIALRTCFAFTEGADPGVPGLPLRAGSGRPDESAPKATMRKRWSPPSRSSAAWSVRSVGRTCAPTWCSGAAVCRASGAAASSASGRVAAPPRERQPGALASSPRIRPAATTSASTGTAAKQACRPIPPKGPTVR